LNFVGGRSQITSRKKLLFRPPPLSQIFQRKKNFVFGLSQILLSPSSLKRDVICERPLVEVAFEKRYKILNFTKPLKFEFYKAVKI